MFVLAIWKARVPRWIAIVILVVGLAWVLMADTTPLELDRPALHPPSPAQQTHA